MSSLREKIRQAYTNALTDILKLIMKDEEERKICGKCGSKLEFEGEEEGGTEVKFADGKVTVTKKEVLPIIWLRYVCPNCGWRLTTFRRKEN